MFSTPCRSVTSLGLSFFKTLWLSKANLKMKTLQSKYYKARKLVIFFSPLEASGKNGCHICHFWQQACVMIVSGSRTLFICIWKIEKQAQKARATIRVSNSPPVLLPGVWGKWGIHFFVPWGFGDQNSFPRGSSRFWGNYIFMILCIWETKRVQNF